MLVGVLSDTHDSLPMIELAMPQLKARGVELILHAGDFIAPFALKKVLEAGIPLIGVIGNCDGEKDGLKQAHDGIFEEPHRFELAGRRIVLAHRPEVLEQVVTGEDDLAICGHVHKAEVRAGRPLFVNPGETCGYLSGSSTGAVVDLESLTAEIIDFGSGETVIP